MEEIFRDIRGYEGIYSVSNKGNIRSIVSGKNLKQTRLNKYKRVVLRKHSKPKAFLVHRLVATAFIKNPLNKPEVNHKNGICDDNNIKNLEWVTRHENINHAHNIGLFNRSGENNGNSVLTLKKVEDIRVMLKEGKRPTKIAEIFNIDRNLVYKIKNGVTWKSNTKEYFKKYPKEQDK